MKIYMSNPPVASVKGTLLKLTLFRLTDKKIKPTDQNNQLQTVVTKEVLWLILNKWCEKNKMRLIMSC